MFVSLADKLNNAFLWMECDLYGGRRTRVVNYTLLVFSPTPDAFLVTTLNCNTQTNLGLRE